MIAQCRNTTTHPTYDASVLAVLRHHGDLTTGEASDLAGVPMLAVPGAIYRLQNQGLVEPREPRWCEHFGRVMAAFILTPKGCEQ